MSTKITKSDLFEELSAEKQELLAGGQQGLTFQMGGFDGDDRDFDRRDDRDFDRRDSRDRESRIRRIPIRLTGILEVVK